MDHVYYKQKLYLYFFGMSGEMMIRESGIYKRVFTSKKSYKIVRKLIIQICLLGIKSKINSYSEYCMWSEIESYNGMR